MTKRGIDDLTFNGSSNAVSAPVGSAPIMSASTPIKINGSPDASTAVAGGESYNITANGGSDYLNGTNGNLSNGALAEDHPGKKKFKGDGSIAASGKSRVVHIRNIPTDTTTSELIMIAEPFGTVTKHLFVRSKGQAFVEFESHFSAMQMASFWIQTTIGGMPTQVQPTIRGRHVHVQVSNHKELKTQYENNNNGSINSVSSNGPLTIDAYGDSEAQHTTAGTSSTPSSVIRVITENQIYPMTLDGLYQVFSRCGKVLKIVTFFKNQQFHALIQFSDIASSIQAKSNYDGQSAYAGIAGINVMRIEYSKLQNLIVKYNNERSRDYSLLTQNGSLNGSLSTTANHLNHMSHSLAESTDVLGIPSVAAACAAVAGFSNPAAQRFHPMTSGAAIGSLNNPHSSATGFNAGFNSRYLSPAGPAVSIQQALSASAAALALPTNSAAMFAAGLPTNFFSSVLHVSGLSPEHITPDALFTLFGVYGDVLRVKILFNKKDTALIQMAEPTQASNAISYLDRTKLFGKAIHVMSSKHQMVQMPKEGHQDSGLTKDYTNSPLHRFKRPGSKNYNNIYPPSETLHVSNIPSTCTEEDLRRAFQQETNKEIVKFKFFPNDHRMALVQFDSIEDAVLALIQMHNYKVAEHSHLRVSFSKSPV